MFNISIIKKTGQIWKLNVTFLSLMSGSGLLFYGVHIMDTKPYASVAPLVVGGLIIDLASVIFGCLSVRCPHCKARWLWQAVSSQSPGNWLSWLMSRTECPKCNS
jgi:hypothetical protein